MTMRQSIHHVVALAAAVACAVAPYVAGSAPPGPDARFEYPFQNPGLADEARISDLIGRLTLEEKIDCLAGSASVPQLGVKGSPHIEGYHDPELPGPGSSSRVPSR